ncbi:MAG: hypothetical protein NW206_07280 [Hyphomonadaceae bacterium]|nr:hypothetical protein [Hyphomonadaceae bacterium]
MQISNASNDEDERAVAALLDAVSFITTALRARPRREALVVISCPRLSVLTQRVVAAFGFQIYTAGSAAEAAPTAASRRFDLIVLEANTAAAHWIGRIRALPEHLGAAPILAVSGQEDLREALSDAGADGFVCEPVTPSRMIDVLALLLGARAEI